MADTRIPTPDATPLTQPRPIPGPEGQHMAATRKVFTADTVGLSSDEEDYTHSSVLSRRLRKRRRTTTAHDSGSNPSRVIMSSLAGSTPSMSPYPSMSLPVSPPMFGLENEFRFPDDSDEPVLRKRKSVSLPDSDMAARQRCYEYIHTAIDAVWAEYCDSTSYAEFQKYMPHSPISESEDPIFGGFGSSGGESWLDLPYAKSGSTAASASARRSAAGHCGSGSISQQPQSQSLMRQKNKLLDAKYFLGFLVSSQDPHDSARFWRAWDQLKYSTVELVEGDDEEADEVIEDLEAGRF